jgi:membrane fusion protein (multidrug efflux system)
MIVMLAAAACGQEPQPLQPAPLEVGIVQAHTQPVPVTRDLVGRLSALRTADVRARIPGVLLKRLYKEGSDVKQGQALFQIDPAPLEAALQAALAGLAEAQANATNAHVLAERERGLAPKGWISRSDLDTAEANERSTAAQVKQAQANVQTARINLGYARVSAPISGRASEQQVTEGALVGQGEATLLTVVEQVDSLYINFDQPANELLALRRAQRSGDITSPDSNNASLEVTLPDGTLYNKPGKLDFADFAVNSNTGALALRGRIPNPDHRLLPGLFVNVHLTIGQLNHAFLVPQVALQRDGAGPYVFVIGQDGKAAERRVNADTMHGEDWIVTNGLTEGDKIIVSDVQKVRPGVLVRGVFDRSAPNNNPN